MLHSTNSKQEEQSTGQNFTKGASKLTYLNNEIAGYKPLKLVGNEEQGYCITFGKFRISEIHKTEEHALAELNQEPWLITINLIAAIIEQINKVGEDTLKNKITP